VREELLHYIWKFQLFDAINLKSTYSEKIEIVKPGNYNTDSGPDFSNAQIRIDGILLIGNIELHINSSDWSKHKHHEDDAYNNVILHVVFNHDLEIKNSNDSVVPTLQLKHLIFPYVTQITNSIAKPSKQIICKKQLIKINETDYTSWMNELYQKRLKHKVSCILEMYQTEKNATSEILYRLIALSFGFKTNALAFELLSKELPFNLLQPYLHDEIKTESLLFGIAGFLDYENNDSYHQQLKNEFLQLKEKHKLNSFSYSIWKFSRMHPQNFPSVRIAQFSRTITKIDFIINHLKELDTYEKWASVFTDKPSLYWQSHYDFGKKVRNGCNYLGELSVNSILINTIVPFLHFYSETTNNESFLISAQNIINCSRPEKNSTINLYSKVLPKPINALQTQAMLQLEKELCSTSGCLNCLVGKTILQQA